MNENKRIAVLYIENETIGDGFFAVEIVNTLREYADMVDRGEAGHLQCEEYIGPRGTKLSIIAGGGCGIDTRVPNGSSTCQSS